MSVADRIVEGPNKFKSKNKTDWKIVYWTTDPSEVEQDYASIAKWTDSETQSRIYFCETISICPGNDIAYLVTLKSTTKLSNSYDGSTGNDTEDQEIKRKLSEELIIKPSWLGIRKALSDGDGFSIANPSVAAKTGDWVFVNGSSFNDSNSELLGLATYATGLNTAKRNALVNSKVTSETYMMIFYIQKKSSKIKAFSGYGSGTSSTSFPGKFKPGYGEWKAVSQEAITYYNRKGIEYAKISRVVSKAPDDICSGWNKNKGIAKDWTWKTW
jgi:hypothetical protein